MLYGLLTWNLGLNLSRLPGQLVHCFLCLWSIDGPIFLFFSDIHDYGVRLARLSALLPRLKRLGGNRMVGCHTLPCCFKNNEILT